MTQKQAEAELKYRLAKYVLQVLLDAGTITAEEMELARKKLCKKYQPFTRCLEDGIQWPIPTCIFGAEDVEKATVLLKERVKAVAEK